MKKLLMMIVAAAIALATALPSLAADWTDASGNEYTALKSINGGGSGLIVTDFKPAGTEIIKFKYKPSTVSGNECVFCSRYTSTAAQFCGFRITSKFRFDRASRYTSGNTTYSRQSTCNTTTLSAGEEYSVVANFGGTSAGTVTINDRPQSLTPAMETASYTPGSVLVLLASHSEAYNVTPTSSSTFSNNATGDLYYLQLWNKDGETLEHDFRPAKRVSDDAIGLYDTATRKFWPATIGSFTGAPYSAIDRAGKKWTGLGGDNKMSNAANWANNDKPGSGDDIDFTIAAPFSAIDADIDATFGKIYLGAGDLPAFTGSLTATSASDLARIQDYADETASFTFSIANYNWNGNGSNWSDAGAWTVDNAPTAWSDGVNAVFDIANAAATLAADVTANSLVFNAPATIGGSSTLTVPTVSVAPGVAATISAPTAGALEKTGAGTLALTQNRAAATTVTEGTLKMDGATVSTLTLGTGDATKSVVFDYGGQTLERDPHDYLVNGADITLTNGTFASTASTSSLNIRDTAKLPSVLTISKDTTLKTGKSGAQSVFDTGALDTTATINIVGGTLDVAGEGFFQHAAKKGRFNFNVRDGLVEFGNAVKAIYSNNAGTYVNPSLYMTFDNSTFRIKNADNDFDFGHDSQLEANLPTTPTGVIAATNSVFVIGRAFHIGRNSITAKTGGSYTADLEGCIITAKCFAVYYDRPLNNARLNNTRFVLNSNGSVEASDDADNWITVGDDGLTLDTQAYACSLNANLGGSGAVTKAGSGKLIVGKNQTSTGALIVNEGTLAVNGDVTIARPTTFASGTTLDLAGCSAGVVPFVAAVAVEPADGTVNLTFNGGAFPTGVYAIYSAAGVTAAEGAKFTPSTGGETAAWSVVGNTLVLTVGTPSGNIWMGLAGDGRMSTAANWAGNAVPTAGSDIDLSGITAATTIIADADRTFGNVTLGSSVITFTNAMAATSFTDTAKIAVAADSTVTIDGDLEISGAADRSLVYTIAEGGRFVVTGDIVATEDFSGANLYPSVTVACPGTFVARGLANRGTISRSFRLDRNSSGSHVTWAIGSDGLVGSGGFQTSSSSGVSATIVAEADFVDSANICNLGSLVIDAAGHEVVLGTNTLAGSGGIYGAGTSTITGGRVVANYDCDNLTTWAGSLNNPFTVNSGATLALVTGADLGTGAVTVQDGGTLEVTESGTVTVNGGLTLDDGATLAFNFTQRANPPVLALAEGSPTVNGAVKVKVSSDCGWPVSGEKVLTTCGGFTGVTVTLDEADKPNWAIGLNVNNDGNIVLSVKPMGMVIFVQ